MPMPMPMPKPKLRTGVTLGAYGIAIVAAVVLNGIAPSLNVRGWQVALGAADAQPLPASSSPAGLWKNYFPGWAGNRRLPEHPALAAQSQAMMDTLYADAPTITGPGLQDDSEAYWTAKTGDPLHTIGCRKKWGPGNGPCLLDGKQVAVPAGALPAENTDHHVSILQPDGCTVDDLWLAGDMSGPVILTEFAAVHDQCRENGFNTHGGAGTTAGGASNRLGHSPLAELRTGVIHHAIIAFGGCDLTSAYVGQAIFPGQYQACKAGVTGIGIPMGAYLWSDLKPANLPLDLNAATRMLCTALHDYGALMNDTNGNWNGLSLGAFWAGTGRPDEYPNGSRTNDDSDGYAAWFAQNAPPDGRVEPAVCFPNRDWSHHIHVLQW